MLKQITWSTFLTVIAVIGILWYFIIALLYYRKEIFNLFSGKIKIPLKNKSLSTADVDADEDDEGTDALEELENIVTDIRHSILEPAGKEASKDELTEQLKDRLANYGGLRQPAFRVALTNFITQQAETICAITYNEAELEALYEALLR